jgi:kinesin family protein 4/21/27
MADRVIPVKVAVRIRPLVPKETSEGCQLALERVEGEPQVFIPGTEKAFTYDFAFAGSSTNEELYKDSVKGMIDRLFEGFNVTVLAYGQTGSGKTHSMGTAYKADTDPELEGVIPRAVKDIFLMISEKKDYEFVVHISFIELYNEQLFDLLSGKARREDAMVDIREDGKGGIKIPGLTETLVSALQQSTDLLL